jgi:hypothetical protein
MGGWDSGCGVQNQYVCMYVFSAARLHPLDIDNLGYVATPFCNLTTLPLAQTAPTACQCQLAPVGDNKVIPLSYFMYCITLNCR